MSDERKKRWESACRCARKLADDVAESSPEEGYMGWALLFDTSSVVEPLHDEALFLGDVVTGDMAVATAALETVVQTLDPYGVITIITGVGMIVEDKEAAHRELDRIKQEIAREGKSPADVKGAKTFTLIRLTTRTGRTRTWGVLEGKVVEDTDKHFLQGEGEGFRSLRLKAWGSVSSFAPRGEA